MADQDYNIVFPHNRQAATEDSGRTGMVFTRPWYNFFRDFVVRVADLLDFVVVISKSLGGTGGTAGVNGLFIQDAAPTPAFTGQKYLWFQTNAVGTQAKMWIDDGA